MTRTYGRSAKGNRVYDTRPDDARNKLNINWYNFFVWFFWDDHH
ncbi:hypothetical protein [Okeania sp. SIO2C2]|nr:hypothetical protein [Okeania sp. SIO2C2]